MEQIRPIISRCRSPVARNGPEANGGLAFGVLLLVVYLRRTNYSNSASCSTDALDRDHGYWCQHSVEGFAVSLFYPGAA